MAERKISQLLNEDKSVNILEYNSLFDKIQSSKTKENLFEIAKDYNINLENTKYPRLGFNISTTEINELTDTKISTNDGVLSINQVNLSPIAKLLFALTWKQGDLQKLKQIIKGIKEVEKPDDQKKDALIFYCFGNHLGNPKKYPIIDQHVIRAFNLFNSNCDSVRKSDKVNQLDRKNYLNWIWKFENENADFLYYLDRILFEIGKAVKLKKR